MMVDYKANPFTLAEDALLMSILKRWTNVVCEANPSVVTSTDKTKAWLKIEQTFNHLTVDGNKGYKTAEVLKVRAEHLERLKNRRELVQNLASGEGLSSICCEEIEPAYYQPAQHIGKSKGKRGRKDDGDGRSSTDEAKQDGMSNDFGQFLRQMLKLREKLLRKEIKIRIHHSKAIFDKEMEILEIKRKNLLQLQTKSEPRLKPKRKIVGKDDFRQKPSWGQSVTSRVEAGKKMHSNIGKRRRKKVVNKNENYFGAAKKKAGGNWGKRDEGTTDNEDPSSLTDEDGMVKLMLENLKIRKEMEKTAKLQNDTDDEDAISKMDFAENSGGTVVVAGKIEDLSLQATASLPAKLSNHVDKIPKKDSTDEYGKLDNS